MKKYTLKHEVTNEIVEITAFSYEVKNYDRVFPVFTNGNNIGELAYPQRFWRVIWIENIEEVIETPADISTKNSEL